MNMSDKGIPKEQIEHLARLAQLDLTEAEVEKFSIQLSSILQYVDRVQEVEISSDVKRDFRKVNVFRDDSNPHKVGEHRDAILAAMPKVEDDMLVVQKILGN